MKKQQQQPFKWVKATDVVFMAVLIMMLQTATILCLTLTSRWSLPAFTGVRSHPSDKEVAPPVSRETVIDNHNLHREMIQPAKQQPWPWRRSQYYYWTQIMPTTTTSHNLYHSRPLWKRWYDYYLHLNWSKLASYKHINFSMTYTPLDKLTI